MPDSALILELDGVLVAPDHGSDPARLRLLPGVVEALRRLALRGVAAVLISDRPAGEDAARSAALLDRLAALLAAEGVALAAAQAVAADAPASRRRPAPGTLLRALAAIGAAPGASWCVGTRAADAHAAASAGCAGCVLVGAAEAPAELADLGIVVAAARDLADAPRVMIPRGGGCWHDQR